MGFLGINLGCGGGTTGLGGGTGGSAGPASVLAPTGETVTVRLVPKGLAAVPGPGLGPQLLGDGPEGFGGSATGAGCSGALTAVASGSPDLAVTKGPLRNPTPGPLGG